jgi:hypothetical protein
MGRWKCAFTLDEVDDNGPTGKKERCQKHGYHDPGNGKIYCYEHWQIMKCIKEAKELLNQ